MLNGKKGNKTKLFGWRYPGFQARFSNFFRGIHPRFSPRCIENTFLNYPASTFRPSQMQCTPVSGPINKSTTIFHGLHSYRPQESRHKMFKTQVEPRAAGEWFHCKCQILYTADQNHPQVIHSDSGWTILHGIPERKT